MACQSTIETTLLQPDPIMRLERLIGYTGIFSKNIMWLTDSNGISNFIIYPCHNSVVKLNVKTGEQTIFLGHTDKISSLATDCQSLLLVTAQTGKNPIIRIWDIETGKCHAILQSHQNEISCLALSDSGNMMAGVGKDGYMKEQIVIWDLSKVAETGKVTYLLLLTIVKAKHPS